jgi:hypothetical protein
MSLNTNPKLYALTTSYNFEQPVLGELTETIRILLKELALLLVNPQAIVGLSTKILNPDFTSTVIGLTPFIGLTPVITPVLA